MAILLGFPPTNTISPSVRITEIDLSFVPSTPAPNIAGLVGFATKGPINVPTLITSVRQLHTVFGFPLTTLSTPYLIYAAEQYLAAATQLYVVRCGATDPLSDAIATTASLEIPSAGGAVTIVSNASSPYAPSTDTFFRWRLNGVISQKILVVLAPANRPSPNTGVSYTTATLAAALNDQLSTEDGITFYSDSTTGKIAVKTTFSYGPDSSIELVSVKSALYGPVVTVSSVSGARTLTNSIFGLGLSMLPAQVVGTLSKYPNNSYQTAGHYDLSGVSSPNLEIVVDGTGSSSIDLVVQTVSLTATTYTAVSLANAINTYVAANLPGGFQAYVVGNNVAITTNHSGRDARMLVKPTSTIASLLGLATTTNIGSGDQGVATDSDTYNDAIVTGSTNTSDTTIFTLSAESPGTSGNLTQVVITDNVDSGSFNMSVYSDGINVESWGNLVLNDPTSRLYADAFLTLVSNYVRTVTDTSVVGLPAPDTYSLTGGTDGIPSDPDEADQLIIGNDIAMTGLQALSDPEQVDVDLVAIPGFSSTAVVTALINLCSQNRQDCMALIDPPFAFTVPEIVAWQRGTHPLNSTQFDSSYAALYWPWVQIRDTYNQIDVWVPPSGAVLATYVLSDTQGAPWMAPAGLNRGLVPNIEAVYTQPTITQRDEMYGGINAINPILQFPGTVGFYIWGQKTLQRASSALNRVNVRRCMLFIEKTIKEQSRALLFEPHDSTLQGQFTRMASSVLDNVKTQRGIYDYFVKCDAELNTPDVVQQNQLRAQIGVQPVYAAEFILIQFAVNAPGSFTTPATTF
jgi:phage tail sheath protein FI